MYVDRIEINKDECIGCKKCVQSCFTNVYLFDEKEGKPVVAYPDDCCWCLVCEFNCPKKCIRVIPTLPANVPSPF